MDEMDNINKESERIEYILGFGEYLRSNFEHDGDLVACMEAYFGRSALGREIIDDIFRELIALDAASSQRES